MAQRAELLGAIRLPNDAFKKNAGTEVVSDILFLQKRDHPQMCIRDSSISMSEDVNRQLEDLYVKFNIDHPNDFRGHSMSVSYTHLSSKALMIPPVHHTLVSMLAMV